LDIQDSLQTLYTSGTVFHAFVGEKMPDWQSTSALIRAVAEKYTLPYYTLSPTYSVCSEHGYISGEHFNCPSCERAAEVYSRITGYYRPVQNWNAGKTQEYKNRTTYAVASAPVVEPAPLVATAAATPVYIQPSRVDTAPVTITAKEPVVTPSAAVPQQPVITPEKATSETATTQTAAFIPVQAPIVEPEVVEQVVVSEASAPNITNTSDVSYLLFVTKSCPNCGPAKQALDEAGIAYTLIYAEEERTLTRQFGVSSAPTLIVTSDAGRESYVGSGKIAAFAKL